MGNAAERETAGGGRMVLRRRPLNTVIFAPWRGAELEVALAALQRIRAYWNATTAHPWCVLVLEDDQGLYQTLTHDLYFALGQRPELVVLTAELRKLIPDQPVDHDLALVLEGEIKGDLFDGLSRARFMLNEVVIAEGGAFGPNRADPLFTHFDHELDLVAQEAKRQSDAFAIKLGLKDLKQPAASATRRAGRPRGRTYTQDDILAKATAYLATAHDACLADFLRYAGIGERTWKRYTRDYGFTWSALRERQGGHK